MKLLTFTTTPHSARKLGAHIEGNTIIDLARAYEVYCDARAPDWFDSVSNLLKGGDRAMALAQELHDLASGKSSDDDSIFLDM